MKSLYMSLFLLFYSSAYSQSDEIKLFSKKELILGKVIIIKSASVQFKQDSTEFLLEFDLQDIIYIKSAKGDTIWFNKIFEEEDFKHRVSVEQQPIKRATAFISYNFLGKHKETSGGFASDPNVNSGISFGVEFDFIKSETDVVKMGLGALYQFSRKQINSNGSFNFVPIYAFIKLNMLGENSIENKERIKAYLIPAFGYNLFYADKKYSNGLEVSGGFYNSFGLGLLVANKLDIKLLYQFNRGCLDAPDNKIEILYRSVDLHCGYYF